MGALRSEWERSEELGDLPREAAICAAHVCFLIEDKRPGENSQGEQIKKGLEESGPFFTRLVRVLTLAVQRSLIHRQRGLFDDFRQGGVGVGGAGDVFGAG